MKQKWCLEAGKSEEMDSHLQPEQQKGAEESFWLGTKAPTEHPLMSQDSSLLKIIKQNVDTCEPPYLECSLCAKASALVYNWSALNRLPTPTTQNMFKS